VHEGVYTCDAAVNGLFRDAEAALVTYMFLGRSDTGDAADIHEGIPDVQIDGTIQPTGKGSYTVPGFHLAMVCS
jgi:hypothetical protein